MTVSSSSIITRLFVVSLFSLLVLVAPVAAQSANPNTVSVLLDEGDELHEALKNQEAIEVYEEAHDLAPNSFDVMSRLSETYNHLGNDHKAAGNKREAEAAIRQAADLAGQLEQQYPDEAQTYFLLAATNGNLAMFLGGRDKVRTGSGVEDFCKAGLAIDPNHVGLLVAYGVFNREVAGLSWVEKTLARTLFGELPTGSMEEAVELFQRAIEINPDHHLAHYELAVTYFAMGRRDDARTMFEKTQELPHQTSQDVRNTEIAADMLARMGS